MAVSPVDSRGGSGLAYYPGPEEYVVALHDFTSQNDTCLSFQSGQVIKVFNRDSSGWWDGELDGHRGWFPSNYVDQDGLMSTSSNGGRMSSLAGADDDGLSTNSYHVPQGPNAIGLRTSGQYDEQDDGYHQQTGPHASSSSSGSSNTANGMNTPVPPPIPRRSSSQNQNGGSRHRRNGSGSVRSPTAASSSAYEAILGPILHAIVLLDNAVRANRVAHFQPSTACVISSVRSALSATDCLTRDSAVLRAHSVLGKERKQILSELTRLVQQSKKASGVMVDESQRGEEMNHMMEMAELVLGHVRRFLEVADECGVPIPDRRGNLYEETYEDRRGGMPIVPATGNGNNSNQLSVEDGRSIVDNRSSAYYSTFTSGQFSPRSSRSFADLRSTHSRSVYVNSHEDDPGMLRVSYIPRSEYRNTMRTTVTTATTAAQYHGALSSSPPDSLHHGRSGVREVGGHGRSNDESMKSVHHADEPAHEPIEGDESAEEEDTGPTKRTPTEVLDQLNTANDDLLSVIAAFIGHVHTHTRQSHGSSFAHLINMACEAVESVRNMLAVVEAVNKHPGLAANRPKEVAILSDTRESLYDATTALVTAARVGTSSGNASGGGPTNGGNATPPNTEEDEKSRLLSSATGVLRTAGECVGAVRLCLSQVEPGMLVAVPEAMKTRSQTAGQHHLAHSTGGVEVEDDEEETEGNEDGDAAGGGAGGGANGASGSVRRGKYTLSFLGRKATSLDCLRERWERDGYQAAFDGIMETEADEREDANGEVEELMTVDAAEAGNGNSNGNGNANGGIDTIGRNSGSQKKGGARSSASGSMRSVSDVNGNIVASPVQMQQDSSPEIELGGNVSSTGRFDGQPSEEAVAVAVVSAAAPRKGRESGVPVPLAVVEAGRQLSQLVLPNGGPAEQQKARRNSAGTNSDGDGSRVSNNSASTSAGSLIGSVSLSRSARSGSEATAETSARPSFERMDTDFSSPVLDTMPHSAPLLGKFPRDGPPPMTSSGLSTSSATPTEDGGASSQGFATSMTHSVSDSQLEANGSSWAGRRASHSNEPIYMQPEHEPEDVVYTNGRLAGATLSAMVEKMTPHDATVDATFSAAFYLCFRMFTTPMELFEAFVARFNLQLPPGVEITDAERSIWLERKVTPIRLRVFNFFKMWLETHFNDATDSVILPKLIEFTRTSMSTSSLARHGQRLAELAQRRLSAAGIRNGVRGTASLQRAYSTDMLRPNAVAMASWMYLPAAFPRNGVMPPQPLIKDKLMAMLRIGDWKNINIMEIDPLELARQITIMGSKLYCSIQPDELLNLHNGSKKAPANNAVGPANAPQSFIKGSSALATAISGWINETILAEDDVRKRVQLLKFFIKLGDRLYSLQNFDGLFAIHAALGSSQIDRLRQTWDALPTKYRALMEQQREAASFAKNWASYRARLRTTVPPALPFLGLFLTDLTFISDGTSKIRPSPNAGGDRVVHNVDRYVKLSGVVTEVQRFQVPYTLLEVPEMQNFLRSVLANLPSSNGIDSANELYKRSKALEPRPSDATLSARARDGGGKGLDIFNWK
ncbi:hypothetical protein A4X06_0g2637 [Tilletia controversa]|uniref:Guanyl nucleotide exchange factor Sql2 n=1 Tax=Tilletia controversa TaxID=13291 RepID=A0A8X7MW25_9BASI|nr:hypothetical protein CF328_g1987 [Tilletia controversa]KAE8251528.1 hypothetical protein A4X06_0g2637 [Tilletia controversa]